MNPSHKLQRRLGKELRQSPYCARRIGVEALEERAVLSTLTIASDGIGGASGNSVAEDFSVISSNGRYLAFVSSSSNLVSGDTNGVADVFVYDKQTGSTTRASVDSNGVQQNAYTGSSYRDVAISVDGRYVAFYSLATNLVPGSTNASGVYVRDMQTGQTTLVSVDSQGKQGTTAAGSNGIAMSQDGRYVAFSSLDNLAPVNGVLFYATDLYVRDRVAGTTERVSWGVGQAPASSSSYAPAISGDGRFVAFRSMSNNIVAGQTSNLLSNIFVYDRQTHQSVEASVSSAGAQEDNSSDNPVLSGDGRYVAFDSRATNLVAGDTNNGDDVFVRDLQAGVTTRVSVAAVGARTASGAKHPAISSDGRYVAFDTYGGTLAGSSINNSVYVYDRQLGYATETVLPLPLAASWIGDLSAHPSISDDGLSLSFSNNYDIYLWNSGVVVNSPTISAIADQSTAKGVATGAISFTIGDAQTAATSLTVSGASSNSTLVPSANLQFGGSGANRTLIVTPAANQVGTATIAVTVTDGGGATAISSFLLTVSANTPPTISTIATRSTRVGVALSIPFTVGDAETAASALAVSDSSSNAALAPSTSLQLTGSGASRTLTVTPLSNQAGMSTITVTVTDGNGVATATSFKFWVNVDAWQNPLKAYDIDGDGSALPLDVILLINDINSNGSRSLTTPAGGLAPANFLDVNGDYSVAPIDVILVINYLNAGGKSLKSAAGTSTSSSSDSTTAAVLSNDAAELAARSVAAPVTAVASNDAALPQIAAFNVDDYEALPALIALLSEDPSRRR